MADDIGEALDLVVGLAKIGGALVDGGFEIEIVVAQSWLRPRRGRARSAAPGRSTVPASAITMLEPAMVTLEARIWLRSALAVRIASSRSSSARIAVADIADGDAGVAGGGLADQRGGVGRFVLLDEVHFASELIEPRVDRRAQLLDVARPGAGLSRRQLRELVGVGNDVGDGGFRDRCRNSGPSGQQIAARGAFGAADFQQQRVDLVLHLDGVDHQPLSLRALLTSSTEATLIATSTKNPAASSRIWPIARRRVASGIAEVMDKRNSQAPWWETPQCANAGQGPVPGNAELFCGSQPAGGWPARYCSSQWMW